jgi:cell division protein FtsN
MPGHLSPDNVTRNSMCNERGSATRVLLLVLLLVVAAGGYLYFFTDLIRPVKEAAKPSVVQTAQVKKPIPPRPGQPGGPEAVVPKPEAAKPSQGAPPPPAQAIPQAKQAAEQKGAPAAAPPAKPEPAKLAKAEAPQKPATAVAPAAVPAKPAAATPKPAAAPAPAKLAAATPKPAAAAAKAKPAAPARPARPAPKMAKRAVKGKRGAYSLQVGDFVPDKAFEAVQSKLKKSGIVPVRMTAITTPEPMKRLAVAQFTDQDAAEAEFQKLKKLTADAFLVADDGTYSLYAGSYFSAGRLHSEQRRLGAKGIKTVVKKVQVPIKVMRVSAGSYASAAEARNDEQRLKKLGLTAKVVMAGKK